MKIAIIQFPGTNCEYEARRMANKAGLNGLFFRWNQDYEELKNFDGFIIPGGFSYEDRVRGGAIASVDPIMDAIKEEAEKGKPVLGICNGAQILVESGLIPGLDKFNIGAGLAVNKRMKEGKVLGTGFYNTWCNIENNSEKRRTAYTYLMEKGDYFKLPLAHGEGRFVMEEKLLEQLKNSGQTLFRYCNDKGEIVDEFPTNPNGSTYNLAGVSNPKGNVLALMPHPERTPDGLVIFESIKKYIDSPSLKLRTAREIDYKPLETKISKYEHKENTLEFFVDLIITDNEARTLVNALRRLGFEKIDARKQIHWEVEYENVDDLQKFAQEIILSNELLNTSKEEASVKFPDGLKNFENSEFSEIGKEKVLESENCYLVRYKDDFFGLSKLDVLKNQLGFKRIKNIKKGLVWQIKGEGIDLDKILGANILFNPYSQECNKINL